MRKNIYRLALAGAVLMLMGACEDGKDEFLSDFSTILSFRNSGEQELALYKTGERTDYRLIVNKSGSDLDAMAQVSVNAMNEATLEAYNIANGTAYRLIPPTCYTVSGSSLQFASSELYKTVDVSISPEDVEAVMDGEGTYVIPFELTDSQDSISVDNKYAFLCVHEVLTPIFGFETTDYAYPEDVVGTSGTVSIENQVVMPVRNLWDFDFTVEMDTDVLDKYNMENETELVPMPEDAFSIEIVPFVAGTDKAKVVVTVDKAKMAYGMQALPLRITSSSNPSFLIDDATGSCVIRINNAVVARSELEEIRPTGYSSYGLVDWDGSGVPGLLDGDPATFCHGDYAYGENDPVYGQYIDFVLPAAINYFAYDFQARDSNANGAPTVTDIYIGNDGETWTKLGTVQSALTSGGEKFSSGVLPSKESFTHLRFAVIKSNAGDCRQENVYWNGAELKLYGK